MAGQGHNAQNYYFSQLIPTGRLEQLPPQSVVDELCVLCNHWNFKTLTV